MSGPQDDRKTLQILSGALLASSVLAVAVLALVRTTMRIQPGLEAATYVAVGWALASPAVAGLLRTRAEAESNPQARRAAHIMSYGLLESSAILCGISLVLSPAAWGLYAALVPIGTMIALFPRE